MDLSAGPAIRREPTLAEQVTGFLKTQIETGRLAPGDSLPSEQDLAKHLKVSRTVIREALALLKHDGIIESLKWGRNKVASDPNGWVLRLEVDDLEDKGYLTHLYEMRFVVEPEAAALVAVRATKRDIMRIKKSLAVLNAVRDAGGDATNESIAFHETFMGCTRNPHFANFVGWLGRKFFTCIRLHVIEANKEYTSIIEEEHDNIVNAIADHDPDLSRQQTKNHVRESAARHGIKLAMP